ncbi:hypothetical protein F5X99DRAFT_427933 [Biscogniauxia marginata]|nr:hypothetical protein F5X99DRAFT_427933 [Biscogniauxia marginata]
MLVLLIAFLSTLAATALSSALPPKIPIATRTFYLPDGSANNMTLPPGVEFISTYNSTTGRADNDAKSAKRLSWHPGSNDKCNESQYFNDKTTSGSPDIDDCRWIADLEDNPKNQGYFQALAGGDINVNGDWCRLQYHNTCVFGIRTHSMFGAQVGSHDIRDMIRYSMDVKPGRDKLQFEGRFQCCTWGGAGQTSTVDWAIFKPL